MQWQMTNYLDESLTLGDMVAASQDLLDRARYIRQVGQRSKIKVLGTWLSQSPMLAVLLCSEELLIKARSQLLSWMESNGLGSGHIQLKNVNPQSNGYWECLQMSEALICMMSAVDHLESVLL